MAATVSTVQKGSIRQTIVGLGPNEGYLIVTGLTASSANTVAHGLPRIPRKVYIQPTGNGAPGVLITLDTSQGAVQASFPGGHAGFDATNVYLYVGTTTECMLFVEY